MGRVAYSVAEIRWMVRPFAYAIPLTAAIILWRRQ